MKYSAFREVKN